MTVESSTPAENLMRYASDPARHGYHCAACGRHVLTAIDGLFHNPAVGSPARFCSPACRQAAYRRRRAGAPENTPLQHRGGRTRRLAPPSD
jgi:hypothetical protein